MPVYNYGFIMERLSTISTCSKSIFNERLQFVNVPVFWLVSDLRGQAGKENTPKIVTRCDKNWKAWERDLVCEREERQRG